MRHSKPSRLRTLLIASALAASAALPFTPARGAAPASVQNSARGGRAEALVAEGAAALERGDAAAARDSFRKALQADPDNVDAHTYLGKPLNRVDGRPKVTGQARFSAEFRPKNLAYAAVVTSTITAEIDHPCQLPHILFP